MGLGIPTPKINMMLESNPLKSIMLVGRLGAVRRAPSGGACGGIRDWLRSLQGGWLSLVLSFFKCLLMLRISVIMGRTITQGLYKHKHLYILCGKSVPSGFRC